MIHGNVDGVKKSVLKELERIYEMPVGRKEFLTMEIVRVLCAATHATGREAMVYIARNGHIADVRMGDTDRVDLPQITKRRSDERLRGLRCIHTHPGGDARLSEVDLTALQSMRLDAMSAIGVSDDGEPTRISFAVLEPDPEHGAVPGEAMYFCAGKLEDEAFNEELTDLIRAADIRIQASGVQAVDDGKPERAMLIGMGMGDKQTRTMQELEQLAYTAGALVAAVRQQSRAQIDPATYIGRGKALELQLECQALEVDLAICDDELSGAQIKNLEQLLRVRVIDRAALILDIFAQRARSREGKLQVELAQLNYRLPRLLGQGVGLSQQGAGIGTRGPGERKLEIDRRHVRRRIHDIERQLKQFAQGRQTQRRLREQNRVPIVALVGYTNAGKSTLLNILSGSDVLAEDKLFATLDPVSRRCALEGGEVLLVDTVGFIDKLPHDLVKAFHSTLEEVLYADVLVHVVDASSPDAGAQTAVVQRVLDELGAGGKPMIVALNKTDLGCAAPECAYAGGIAISAKTGEGIDALLARIQLLTKRAEVKATLEIPFRSAGVQSFLHKNAQVLSEAYDDQGVQIEVIADEQVLKQARNMLER